MAEEVFNFEELARLRDELEQGEERPHVLLVSGRCGFIQEIEQQRCCRFCERTIRDQSSVFEEVIRSRSRLEPHHKAQARFPDWQEAAAWTIVAVMTPKPPGFLVRHIQQKRCVVFVGAGLSAGAGLPTWKDLLLRGIQELVGSLPRGEVHQQELSDLVKWGKLLEVADFCKEKLGGAYHQFLSEQVRGDQVQKLPATHDVLMRLPFSAWVTTNYDKLLERAYAQVKGGGSPKTLTHKDTEALGRLLFDGGPFILKAHGDIDRPETVVLTSRDYSEIIHANPAFNEIFSGLLLTKALLFVGYSLSDPDFRLLMDRQLTHFKGFVPERYALMTGVGEVEQDVLWRTARIRVISYDNTSKTHAEVLEFLKALETEVLPKFVPEAFSAPEEPSHAPSSSAPVLESMPPPQSVPSPAPGVAQSWQVTSHNAAAGSGPGHPAPVSRVAELLRQAEEDEAHVSQTEPPPRHAPVPQPAAARVPAAAPARVVVPLTPHRLHIEPMEGGIQLRLLPGDAASAVLGALPPSLSEEVEGALPESGAEGAKSIAARSVALAQSLFQKHLPRELLQALDAQDASAQAPLVLHIAPSLARFPWELLPAGSEPVCLKRRVSRAPTGVPAQVRGTPAVRFSPRILLVEGMSRDGSVRRRELERLRALTAGGAVSCSVLQGSQATFPRFMEALRADQMDELPDLLHYTGELGFAGSEPCLQLRDGPLPLAALRSVLSQGRLPFLVINAPGSAYGSMFRLVAQGRLALRLPKPGPYALESGQGFMELAMQQGVGAFVGLFEQPEASAGADFMVQLHRALLMGQTLGDAVLMARREVHDKLPTEPTPLLYVLSGDGGLQLLRSQPR